MMGLWFTHSDPEAWDPNIEGYGYSELFARQVRSLRARFELRKEMLGVDVWADPENYILHYSQKQSRLYCVALERLEWMWYERKGGVARVYFTLLLHVRQTTDDRQVGKSIFRDRVKLYFPCSFPLDPPAIHVSTDWKSLSYVVDTSSGNPRLCVFNGVGEWTIQHTACRAVEAVVEWAGYNLEAGKLKAEG